MHALPAFTADQAGTAKRLLAGHVATMMGRKMEEGDWSRVYCRAKNIPESRWSNVHIDVMHSNLGIEHKMLCLPSAKPILEACGTSKMHPAGTRSIRIPPIEDATEAARDVLAQYADLIRYRTALVAARLAIQAGKSEASIEAASLAEQFGVTVKSVLPLLLSVEFDEQSPAPQDAIPDMRFGWLLWQASLREFLYFEQPMSPPDPAAFKASWVESGGGSRKKSRNLWVYDVSTDRKVFSITTDAGAKIQPYFDVPAIDDPNLYHFVVQREPLPDGIVRLWVTTETARVLVDLLGSLEPTKISGAVAKIEHSVNEDPQLLLSSDEGVVELLVFAHDYDRLNGLIANVSDEHLMREFCRVYRSVALQ